LSVHMVFKLFSLDFRAWKPMCINIYGFQDLFNFGFPSLKTHVCWHIWVFKLFSTLDFWAWKPMCTSTYSFQI
jgi:hypothetical protein